MRQYACARGILFPFLYPITDSSIPTDQIVRFAERLATAGVQLIQIRLKTASSTAVYAQTHALLAALVPRGVRLIVNDRPDIAAISGAGGVHIGQEDLPAEAARQICRPPQWVGVSTHNLDQLREADRTSADYIAVGPIFPTGTKGNPDPVVGVEFVAAARRLTRKPLVAIGGITAERAEAVYRAGADSLTVVSDLTQVADPAARVHKYAAAFERARAR